MGQELKRNELHMNFIMRNRKFNIRVLIKTSIRYDESLMIQIQYKNTVKITNKHSSNFCSKLVMMHN